jgi:hypothetical protein
MGEFGHLAGKLRAGFLPPNGLSLKCFTTGIVLFKLLITIDMKNRETNIPL